MNDPALIIMIPLLLLGLCNLIFCIWMLIDCIQNEPSEGNNKLIWILIIIFAQLVGALIYFFVGRPQRGKFIS